MLRLPEFDYVRPKTLKEAAAALADFGPEAMAVAGGTDLYPKMKRGQFAPRCIVSVRTLPELKGIRSDKKGLWIGAGETLTHIARSGVVRDLFPALAEAAGLVSTPQLRNVGTIGGNVLVDTRCNYYDQSFYWREAAGFCLKKDGEMCLVAPKSERCLAVFSSDTAPVLCSLNAEALITGPKGSRRVPFERLYRNDGIHFVAKKNHELLQAIIVPRPTGASRSCYLKLRRRGSFDFPVLGVAATLNFKRDACTAAKVALTAVASAPVMVDASALEGQRVTRERIEAVAEAAARVSHPVDNADMDYWYRKRMTKVYVTRALAQLAGLDLKHP
jgi:4-hydroxybenzoyl-CoA reductase subunit beta